MPLGLCPKRTQLRMGFPQGQGKITIVAAALTERGRIAPFFLFGASNRDACKASVETLLVLALRPGEILVMATLSSQKGP